MRHSGCGDGAIAPIEAQGLQVAVFASVLALVAHRERLRFVRLHSGHDPFEHCPGLSGHATWGLLRAGGSRERESDDTDHTEQALRKHGIPLVVGDVTHYTPVTVPRELACPAIEER
jgi:hypothetical protein